MARDGGTELDEAVGHELAARVGEHVSGSTEGAGLRIGLACARFNGGISQRLLGGALTAAAALGVARSDLVVAWVPGAFELPLAARALAVAAVPCDAVVALGAVIRGETGHYDFVAGECARGLMAVQLETGIPVLFGVLTTDSVDQALSRSAPDETNKGYEGLSAAVAMATLLRRGPFAP